MPKDTRQLIIEKSYELFLNNGYSVTSMRQIADACDIHLGSLCYFFNKKEDLFMHFHKELYSAVSLLLSNWLDKDLDPWVNYIAREYCFLYKCAFDLRYRNIYIDAINIPTLRFDYYQLHYDQFINIFSAENLSFNLQDAYNSTIVVSAAEFHLMEVFNKDESKMNFDDMCSKIFSVHMHLLGIPDSEQKEYIQKGLLTGKDVLSKTPSLIDM